MHTKLTSALLAYFAISAFAIEPCTLSKNQNNEYLIASYQDLLLIGQGACTVTASDVYRVTANFSAQASSTQINGTGFGIGPLPHFYGKLHGGGHTISDLTIYLPDIHNVGLFSSIRETGLIDSLELANVNIKGKVEVGAFAARNFGTLNAVRSTGTISVDNTQANPVYGGGIVAYNIGPTDTTNGLKPAVIKNSSSAVNITGNGAYVCLGGLVSFNTHRGQILNSYATGEMTSNSNSGRSIAGGLVGDNWGVIETSYATGNITATNSTTTGHYIQAGGFVGKSSPGGGTSEPFLPERGTIRQCWAKGNVQAISKMENPSQNYSMYMDVGGFAGFNSGVIHDSYASGSVNLSGTHSPANWYAGALVGNNYYTESLINNSYALGQIQAQFEGTINPKLGALIGSNQGRVQNSYWPDTTLTTACHTSSGTCSSNMLSIDDIKKQESFTNFDFTSIWSINENQSSPILNALLKPLTVFPTNASQIYNGIPYTGHSGISSIPHIDNLESILEGSANLSGSSQGAIDVGTYETIISGYANSKQDGFRISYLKGTLIIKPAELLVTGLSVQEKIYDGSTDATILGTATLEQINILNNDDVSINNCTTQSQFDNKNAGENKIVALPSCDLIGTDALNYKLKGNLNGTILPMKLIVSADTLNKFQGTKDPAFTYKLNTPLKTNDILSGKLTRTAGEAVGTYNILQGTLDGAPNYTLDFTSAPFSIKPAKTPVLLVNPKQKSEFNITQGIIKYKHLHGPVNVYDSNAKLVKSFNAMGSGEVYLNLTIGQYWIKNMNN